MYEKKIKDMELVIKERSEEKEKLLEEMDEAFKSIEVKDQEITELKHQITNLKKNG